MTTHNLFWLKKLIHNSVARKFCTNRNSLQPSKFQTMTRFHCRYINIPHGPKNKSTHEEVERQNLPDSNFFSSALT